MIEYEQQKQQLHRTRTKLNMNERVRARLFACLRSFVRNTYNIALIDPLFKSPNHKLHTM